MLFDKINPNIQIASKTKTIKTYRVHGKKSILSFLTFTQKLKPDDLFSYQDASAKDFDTACDNFINKLQLILDDFFPIKHITVNSSDPPFITANIKALLRKKNRLMHRGKISEADKITDNIRNMIIRNNTSTFVNASTRKNMKQTWKKINMLSKFARFKSTASKGANINAEELNNYFASISNDKNYCSLKMKSYNTLIDYRMRRLFEEEEVFKALLHLKKTATGHDKLPSWYLTLCAGLISSSVTMIFNDSIHFGYLPKCFHYATITPIAKTKNPMNFGDYRPINVTSILSRIFDKLFVKKCVYPTMLNNNNLDHFKNQYAFRPTGSCESALIALLHHLTLILSRTEYVALIVFDMSKAFDTINHKSVILGLDKLNVPDNIHNWIITYLSDRMHCTRYDNDISSYKPINAGVVQGSGLGPALFSIATADYKVRNDSNIVIKYADDYFMLIPQFNINSINEEIDNLIAWSLDKNLKVNREKSKIMYISDRRKFHPSNISKIDIGCIREVDEMTILGITFQFNLSFTRHIDNVVSKCNKLFYILRILRSHKLDNTSCRDMFFATVVSNLTYCIQAWFGFSKKHDIDRLRKVYKRGHKLRYVADNDPKFDDIVASRARKLFKNITGNNTHVLNNLLPHVKQSNYELRERSHPYSLPTLQRAFDERNFLIRMLYT